MTRQEAYKLLIANIANGNLIKHMLATEATMRALYVRLNPNPNTQTLEEWGLVGLLHDLDYEKAKEVALWYQEVFVSKHPGSFRLGAVLFLT